MHCLFVKISQKIRCWRVAGRAFCRFFCLTIPFPSVNKAVQFTLVLRAPSFRKGDNALFLGQETSESRKRFFPQNELVV